MNDSYANGDQDHSMESEQPSGFAVTVTDNGDGTYSVAPMDQDQSPDEPPTETQTASSIEEACQMMAALFSQESGEAESSEDPNAPLPQDKAKAVWDQMAAKRGMQK